MMPSLSFWNAAMGAAWWDGDVVAAAILGIVQGITEFLPISSSGHLAILPWAFRWSSPVLNSLPFAVALHIGTLLAVLLVFWRDILSLAGALLSSIRERDIQADPERRLAWLLVLATLPAVVAGLLLEEAAATVLRSPWIIAGTLAGVGIILWVVDARHTGGRGVRQPRLAGGAAHRPGASFGDRARGLSLGQHYHHGHVAWLEPGAGGTLFLLAHGPNHLWRQRVGSAPP